MSEKRESFRNSSLSLQLLNFCKLNDALSFINALLIFIVLYLVYSLLELQMIDKRKVSWTVPCFFFIAGFFMESVCANKQCREERSINGMALQGFVFKKFSVRAFHECDISCERELTCQSYNYVVGEKSCELNTAPRRQDQNISAQTRHVLTYHASGTGVCTKV